jgi:hypothetical protein
MFIQLVKISQGLQQLIPLTNTTSRQAKFAPTSKENLQRVRIKRGKDFRFAQDENPLGQPHHS